jgi:hypothetical protein
LFVGVESPKDDQLLFCTMDSRRLKGRFRTLEYG